MKHLGLRTRREPAMKPCIFTGRLIRAYLEVALSNGKAIDKIGVNHGLIREVAFKLMELEKATCLRDGRELHDALMTLRKNMGLSTLGGLKKAVAAGSILVGDRSSRG